MQADQFPRGFQTFARLNLDRSHSFNRGTGCLFLPAQRSPELAKPSAGTEPTALRRPPTCPPTRGHWTDSEREGLPTDARPNCAHHAVPATAFLRRANVKFRT